MKPRRDSAPLCICYTGAMKEIEKEPRGEQSFTPAVDVSQLTPSPEDMKGAYSSEKQAVAREAADKLEWNDRPTQADFTELLDRSNTRVPFQKLRTWWAEGQREAGRLEPLPRQGYSVAERSYLFGETPESRLTVTLTGLAKQGFKGGRDSTDILVSIQAERDGVAKEARDVYKVSFEGDEVAVAVGEEKGFRRVEAGSDAYNDALNYVTMSQEPETVSYREGWVPNETPRESSDSRSEKDAA